MSRHLIAWRHLVTAQAAECDVTGQHGSEDASPSGLVEIRDYDDQWPAEFVSTSPKSESAPCCSTRLSTSPVRC